MTGQQIAGNYVGRFAPSPTGQLHFGSAVAAIASFLQARASNGAWLLRIEDLDPPREVPGSAAAIQRELSKLGLEWDGPVLLQSQRSNAYEQACELLLERGLAYYCGCSRSDLPAGGRYPGTCRNGLQKGRRPRSIRLRTCDETIEFEDAIQGLQSEQLERTSGDFVIRRADGLYAYQLAVVVDDAMQGITEVLRGADLLESTPRQIWLQRCLGLATPRYAHVPVAVDEGGNKLSKRSGSDPLSNGVPESTLRRVLQFLGQQPPPDLGLEQTWKWAIHNWNLSAVPAVPTLAWSHAA